MTKTTTGYVPIPLPDYTELPVDEMRRRARAFYDGIRTRHTVREFSPRPVPRDVIEQCLMAAGTARAAPTISRGISQSSPIRP